MYAHIHLQPIPPLGLFYNFSIVAHVVATSEGSYLRSTEVDMI